MKKKQPRKRDVMAHGLRTQKQFKPVTEPNKRNAERKKQTRKKGIPDDE